MGKNCVKLGSQEEEFDLRIWDTLRILQLMNKINDIDIEHERFHDQFWFSLLKYGTGIEILKQAIYIWLINFNYPDSSIIYAHIKSKKYVTRYSN